MEKCLTAWPAPTKIDPGFPPFGIIFFGIIIFGTDILGTVIFGSVVFGILVFQHPRGGSRIGHQRNAYVAARFRPSKRAKRLDWQTIWSQQVRSRQPHG
jgi:hypothetical protein